MKALKYRIRSAADTRAPEELPKAIKKQGIVVAQSVAKLGKRLSKDS